MSLIFPVPNWKKCTYEKKNQTVGSSCQRKIDLVGFPPCSGDTSYHASSLGMTYLLLGVSGHLHGTAHTALLPALVRTNIFIVKILTMYSFLGSSFLLSICLGCGDTSVLVVPVWVLLSPGLNH